MASIISFRNFLVGLVLAIVTVLYKPVDQRLTTVGIRRPADKIPTIHGHETKIIADTLQCEDLHHHADSGLLFTACQTGDAQDRYQWFPPLGVFKDHKKAKGGALVIVDPKTFQAKQLTLEGFTQDFVTHGIDVISDGADKSTVYIFAVNHLPNPLHYLASGARNDTEPKARSQIEVFTHKIGTSTAVHKRSIRSAQLIQTPNDIVATSPTGLYVTNDHHYREGFGRMLEDMLTRGSAPWTTISFITITDRKETAAEAGFYGFPIMRGMHNSNGLGHPGPDHPFEIITTDASGGVMYRLQRRKLEEGLKLIEEIQMPICLDNPSWYEDLYKTKGNDASGYILNGLARGIDVPKYITDPAVPAPVQVYHVRANGSAKAEKHKDWEQRLVFSDPGIQPRTVSGAVVVGIDPKMNSGKKQGWLYMTGFLSNNMVATKIDL